MELPIVRPETPADGAAVRRLNELAFGRADEARLVDRLRDSGVLAVSLVAEVEGRVAGHIAFSPVTGLGAKVLGLAPMAVAPKWQGQGIGSRLVREGLAACRRTGAELVVVLGHPGFYPRFGFVPAAPLGIGCEYAVPADAFMVTELVPGVLAGRRGVVRFRPEFAEV